MKHGIPPTPTANIPTIENIAWVHRETNIIDSPWKVKFALRPTRPSLFRNQYVLLIEVGGGVGDG